MDNATIQHLQRWADIRDFYFDRRLLNDRPIHELVLLGWAFGGVLAILYEVWL